MTDTSEKPTSYGPFRLEITGKLVQKAGFRIGAADSLSLYTDLPVLRWEPGRTGKPYIPGSSLRGVMRAHLERERGLLGLANSALESLFGRASKGEHDTPSCRGRLRVMDCLPDTVLASFAEVRDHVGIDPDTGAARDTAKFDAEHVVKDQVPSFPFHLIYEGESKDDPELILMGEAVQALQRGDLLIGSRASIGFGRFELETVQFKVFDRATPEGLRDFLAFRLDPNIAPPHRGFAFPTSTKQPVPGDPRLRPLHRLSFELSIPCNGPLLVKEAAKPKDLASTDQPGIGFLKGANAQPLVPGASIRGVLRHRAEKICTAQRLGSGPVSRLFGSKKDQDVSTERRGLVQIEDCILDLPDATGSVSSDHVAVDRITHAAADGAKFDDRALNGPMLKVTIRAQFTDEPADRFAIALLLFLIRDLKTEGTGIAFGSQTSRGYGSIHAAALTKLSGSLHGSLAHAVSGGGVVSLARKTFVFPNGAIEDPWPKLCATFHRDWVTAPRAVPA